MYLVLLDFFIIINDHYFLIVLASVFIDHKTATKADALNKIVGLLKYVPEKIGAGGLGKTANKDEWDRIF